MSAKVWFLVFCVLLLIFMYGCGKEADVSVENPQTIIQESQGVEKMGLEGKKVLMIVAPANFRDEELFDTKRVLGGYGADVIIASKGVAEAKGALGGRAIVDIDIADVNAGEYDAVVFIGGPGAAVYFDDKTVLSIARDAYDNGKTVGAICIAPSILANAGILEGKKATSFSSEKGNLEGKGASYTGKSVTVDGKIITANGPSAAAEFGRKIAENLLSR